jgi:2-polyprenyl-6-hydroxyphenyl methylase / 3-demethylubiquinone-9 3-methyltransferase
MSNDLAIFEEHARDWWNPKSPWFRSLHAMHEHRRELIRAWAGERLRGATVVDLGCGGGLLAEPLARGGARVVGVELGRASVGAAREHARESGSNGRLLYVRADAQRAPLANGCADLVLAADLLEHVPSWRSVVAEAARLLRPGGLLFVNTIDRSWRARLLAVFAAEAVGLVPRGTHDFRLFIRPVELAREAGARGLELVHLTGERPRLWRTLRTRALHLAPAASTALSYSALFTKRFAGAAGVR